MVKNLIIFLLLILPSLVLAQDNLSNKNEELSEIRQEIKKLEQEIEQKSIAESESLHELEKINKQNLLLNKLINGLLFEEKYKEYEIATIDSGISKTESEIKFLKDSYSKYLVWVYKNKGDNTLKYLFNAGSINKALFRLKYLNYLTKKSKENLAKLKEVKNDLLILKDKRNKELLEKEKLIKEKESEQKVLNEKKKEKNTLLKSLKKDKKYLNKEITDKRNSEIMIKNLISKLIEEERIRKTKEKEKRLSASDNKNIEKTESTDKKETQREKIFTSINYDSFENFSSLKGKLNWPVKSGTIIRKFGENVNEKLKTVTLNYGIDIKTSGSMPVLAVAEGVVSAVDWIPGFGSVVIITHSNNYRTVYGHVGDLFVTEGVKVKRGMVLGNVNESLEGNILHFEIWNDRNYQNPQVWLSR
ncbi:MAG TPA: peptidoglycan DD-metalloendopeptidase family protein [Melioribacteraceae bacterium]|nr:peptidoglycan DD-metalloendopeptidase family protein [Melioribacteraceae bacterium]